MKMWNKVYLLLLVLGLLLVGPVAAAITGDCVDCHTMHNSQDGSVVSSDGPVGNLLVSDCIGCHSSTGSETIGSVGGSSVPIVYNQSAPSKPLAGGNFHWVVASGDNYGHNVFGIVGQDNDLAVAPGAEPGIESIASCSACHAALENGCQSCHWPRHHAVGDANGIADQGDGWYRFLGSAMDAAENPDGVADAPGVTGIEDANWEQTPSSTAHNVYKGTTTGYGDGDSYYPAGNSIGSFCAGCHENFHTNMLGGPPVSLAWIRHPSDVVLPDEDGSEYAAYTTYNPLAPVAKATLNAAGVVDATVVPGEDLVTCISCHRAHGSPYPDMLRWDYQNDCIAGTDDTACGCFVCHTAKDAD